MEKNSVRELVTDELCAQEVKKNVRFSFLSGVLRGACDLHFSFGGFVVEIAHKNKEFIELCADVIGSIYGERPDVGERNYEVGLGKDLRYNFFLEQAQSIDLLQRCYIVKNKYEFVETLPKDLISSNVKKKAFLRGLYLACGNLRVPGDAGEGKNNGYTLSFNLNSDKVMSEIVELIAKESMIEVESVRIKKNTNYIYLKNSEAICNTLTAIGSIQGTLEIYSIMATKQVLNNANRARNCDMANIEKSIKAVSAQLNAIGILEESGTLNTLSDELKETCRLRKEYPDLGIEQLGREFKPPVGKSCVNHRLRKICALADGLKNNAK